MIKYFDNCATTKVDDEVITILNKYSTECYFNPSARSSYSLQVANDVNNSRERIAKCLGCNSDELFFTSGGTESDNIAISGALNSVKHGNVVVTMSEHSAVYNTVVSACSHGLELRLANVTMDGHIDVDDFVRKVDGNTVMAIFMHVNNETGAVNNVKEINQAVKDKNPNVITFSDGVQAVGKVPVNLRYFGVDMYSFSGHKLHCSKGTGCLYVKRGTKVNSIVFGGGQESGLRSGTEFVAGCVALSTAVNNATKLVDENTEKYNSYKNIIRNCLANVNGWKENCTENVSPAIMSLAFKNIKSEVLLHMLEEYEIVVGTGSACSSKNKQSRIAKAINMPIEYTEGLMRISFSKYNTLDEVQLLGEELACCVSQLRKTMLGE